MRRTFAVIWVRSSPKDLPRLKTPNSWRGSGVRDLYSLARHRLRSWATIRRQKPYSSVRCVTLGTSLAVPEDRVGGREPQWRQESPHSLTPMTAAVRSEFRPHAMVLLDSNPREIAFPLAPTMATRCAASPASSSFLVASEIQQRYSIWSLVPTLAHPAFSPHRPSPIV